MVAGGIASLFMGGFDSHHCGISFKLAEARSLMDAREP